MAVDVSPDGKYVAVGTDYTTRAIVWDVASGDCLKSVDVSKYPVGALFFSNDSRGFWAAGTLDKQLRYWPLGGLPKKGGN